MSSALVIIDMQHDFVMPGAPFTVRGAQASVPALRRLLDGCRERAGIGSRRSTTGSQQGGAVTDPAKSP